MPYRVSRSPCGGYVWWLDGETIPADYTDVRSATPAEAAIMDQTKGRAPSDAQVARLDALFAQYGMDV
jgi:hypothetical protein